MWIFTALCGQWCYSIAVPGLADPIMVVNGMASYVASRRLEAPCCVWDSRWGLTITEGWEISLATQPHGHKKGSRAALKVAGLCG